MALTFAPPYLSYLFCFIAKRHTTLRWRLPAWRLSLVRVDIISRQDSTVENRIHTNRLLSRAIQLFRSQQLSDAKLQHSGSAIAFADKTHQGSGVQGVKTGPEDDPLQESSRVHENSL